MCFLKRFWVVVFMLVLLYSCFIEVILKEDFFVCQEVIILYNIDLDDNDDEDSDDYLYF